MTASLPSRSGSSSQPSLTLHPAALAWLSSRSLRRRRRSPRLRAAGAGHGRRERSARSFLGLCSRRCVTDVLDVLVLTGRGSADARLRTRISDVVSSPLAIRQSSSAMTRFGSKRGTTTTFPGGSPAYPGRGTTGRDRLLRRRGRGRSRAPAADGTTARRQPAGTPSVRRRAPPGAEAARLSVSRRAQSRAVLGPPPGQSSRQREPRGQEEPGHRSSLFQGRSIRGQAPRRADRHKNEAGNERRGPALAAGGSVDRRDEKEARTGTAPGCPLGGGRREFWSRNPAPRPMSTPGTQGASQRGETRGCRRWRRSGAGSAGREKRKDFRAGK